MKPPVRPGRVPTCPICGAPIAISAVSENLDFSSSLFWGDRGFRTIVCLEGAHMHFRVVDPASGETAERYAFLVPHSIRGESR